MPSVRYYNASAPFWDFVAEMENHATTNNRNTNNNNEGSDNEGEQQPNPWAGAWGAPWGAFPFRGRRHGPPHHPHHHESPPPPPPPADGEHDPEEGPSGPPPPFSEKPDDGAPEHPHRRGSHGHGPGPHRRCGGPGARGGPWGGRGRGGFWGGGRGRGHFHPYAIGPFAPLAEMFQTQLFGEDGNTTAKDNKDETFHPEVDVFDTPESFVVHISLPGAKKEDVGVNWDADKSELSIGGVVYRPGDEEFLKTLALDERKVGAFERKVRLGSRANPAQVDVEGITARMEDGVLTVEVPKLDAGYVEVRKVDVE